MLTAPQPNVDEIRDNAAFEALMWAFSRPGSVQALPEPGLDCLALALIDRECRVFADTPHLSALVSRAGASLVPAAEADHAFLSGHSRARETLEALPAGSALYPDDGATLIVAATIGEGATLRLTGPGIETETRISLGGLPEGFFALRDARIRYPEGVDIAIVDGARLVALPRSTRVEVL
ncbi:phosphonate C-P lyase system protein PhnH [Halovulum dunhuangense]|uniref:Phosphonate C-P lyase system protein PhnH n=1 Tax=Halovulum dunhuangense TaxID=1505036 RepID=A0A849L221_9RHOB|nr:phosphonate C-P lyase system protein PhnH [Halovulum dunhuangense]NNU80356.1 phosphonate C-P lyase system protein PhnH [Halovulum dunhuangense]